MPDCGRCFVNSVQKISEKKKDSSYYLLHIKELFDIIIMLPVCFTEGSLRRWRPHTDREHDREGLLLLTGSVKWERCITKEGVKYE